MMRVSGYVGDTEYEEDDEDNPLAAGTATVRKYALISLCISLTSCSLSQGCMDISEFDGENDGNRRVARVGQIVCFRVRHRTIIRTPPLLL